MELNFRKNLAFPGGLGETDLECGPAGRYRHYSAVAGMGVAPQVNGSVSTWNESRAVWINRILGIDVGIVSGGRLSRFSPRWIGPGVLPAWFLARPLFLALSSAGSVAR